MKKILHKTLAIFFIFFSSLIGLSNSTAQTGTLTVNPATVSEFPNANGTGNTLLTMTSSGAAKVLITHQSTKGSTTTVETIVVNGIALFFTDRVVNYIQPETTHTFRLYATTAGSSVLGALLATVIVTGGVSPPAKLITLSASPQNVTAFTITSASGVTPITYSSGSTVLSWSTLFSPRTLITLTKTTQNGDIVLQNGLVENLVIKNNTATNLNFPIAYIQKDVIHTFKLYTGQKDLDVLGAFLGEFVVYGYDPAALGINDQIEKRNNEGVTVSTNPFTDQFRINIIDRKVSTFELSIFDIGGKMISAPKIIRADTDFMYDASTLQKGVYLLKITLDNKSQLVRKIVKI